MTTNAGTLKKGNCIILDGKVWVILKAEHNYRGRGSATLKSKIRNIKSGITVDKTFRGDESVELVEVDTVSLQYLYADNEDLFFMNNQSYEQYTLSRELVGDLINYLKEGQTVHVTIYEGQPLAIVPPKNVTLKVTEAEDAVKGDTTGSARKIVTLETGAKVKVPLFIKQGEIIIVSPETGEYVERG